MCCCNADISGLFTLRVPDPPPRILSKYIFKTVAFSPFLLLDIYLHFIKLVLYSLFFFMFLIFCLHASCFCSACFPRCRWCTSCCEKVAQNTAGGFAFYWAPSLDYFCFICDSLTQVLIIGKERTGYWRWCQITHP